MTEEKHEAPVMSRVSTNSGSVSSRFLFIWMLLSLTLTACVSQGVRNSFLFPESGATLDAWLENELGPYLEKEVSTHPRFHEEPILLVAMDGENVRPRIDGLTEYMRSRVLDHLLKQGGVNLVWRPSVETWEHHRRPPRLACGTGDQAAYYIGFEVTRTVDGLHQVRVRALDRAAGTWVSGFGKTWNGRLTAEEEQRFVKNQVDPYLRGLRVLPFSASEPDLLASYLSSNLGCLLRTQGNGVTRIFIKRIDETGRPGHQALGLVGHYLGRLPGIEIIDDEKTADLVLEGSTHRLHGSLYQVWVTVTASRSELPLKGLNTHAYLTDEPNLHFSNSGQAQASPQAQPATDAGILDHGILSTIELYSPPDPALCDSGHVWRRGRRARNPIDVIEPDDCFGLEVELARDARVFLLNHLVDGRLVRLVPSACAEAHEVARVHAAGERFTFPPPNASRRQSFGWEERGGYETLYVIGAADEDAGRQVEEHLDRLGDGCGSGGPPVLHGAALDLWLRDLDVLIRGLGSRVQWRGMRVGHVVNEESE